MPPAQQRRRCSYRRLERILLGGRSLDSHAVWAMVLIEKLRLRPPCFCLEAPPPGYAVLWSVGVGAAGAPVAIRGGSRFIASFVVVDKAQTADGFPRGRWPTV